MRATPEARANLAPYALQLLELTKRWRIPSADLLSPLGLEEAKLEDTRTVVSHEHWLTLLDRARELTGEPGIGIHLGLQMRVSAFGFTGFTVMSAPTLGDALTLATQFGPVVTKTFDIKLRIAGSTVAAVENRSRDQTPTPRRGVGRALGHTVAGDESAACAHSDRDPRAGCLSARSLELK